MPTHQPISLPDLQDPDILTKEKVDDLIRYKTAGFYVLGTLGDNKVMTVSYVGRSDDDLAAKLRENMEPFAGAEQTARLARGLGAIETLRVRELTALLALPDSSEVDSAKAE